MDRFTIAVAGAVLALVVVALAAAAVLRGRAAPPDLGTPSGVVLAYAQAEQRGDALAAWDLLASSAQAKADKERFLARAGRPYSGAYLSTEDERIDTNGASVVLVQTYASSGGILRSGSGAARSTVRLVQEPAGWRITVPPDDYLLLSPK